MVYESSGTFMTQLLMRYMPDISMDHICDHQSIQCTYRRIYCLNGEKRAGNACWSSVHFWKPRALVPKPHWFPRAATSPSSNWAPTLTKNTNVIEFWKVCHWSEARRGTCISRPHHTYATVHLQYWQPLRAVGSRILFIEHLLVCLSYTQ